MSKVNFLKVEQVLMEGLLKMNVQELLHLADLASFEFNLEKRYDENSTEHTQKAAEAITKALINLQYNLKQIRKHDYPTYRKLGMKTEDLKPFFDHPGDIKREEWKKIKEIQNKIDSYKKEIKSLWPHPSDEEIVNLERKKQKYKRFNINEKWLPLK